MPHARICRSSTEIPAPSFPPSVLAGVDLSDTSDCSFTLLRKEEAMALVMSALKLMRLGPLDVGLLRSHAVRILEAQSGSRYRYEHPIEEIVDDLVWIMN